MDRLILERRGLGKVIGDLRLGFITDYHLPMNATCYFATIVLINAMIDKIVDVASASD